MPPARRRRQPGRPTLPGEPWLRRILDGSLDAIITMDGKGRIKTWNPQAEGVFGWPAHEAVGRNFVELVLAPGRRERYRRGIRRVLATARDPIIGQRVETSGWRHDGTEFPMELTLTALRHGRAWRFSAFARDLSERRVAQATELRRVARRGERALAHSRDQLDALSRRVVEVQELERAHIARELHAQIGQALSAVKVNLEVLQRQIGEPAHLGRVRESIAAVRNAVHQVQTLSFELRPSLLDDLGLASAVEEYCRRRCDAAGLALALALAAERPVAREVETACFRILQEAITNVVRHARASEVWVELRTDAEGVRLTVRDNGVGFDSCALEAHPTAEHRLGLLAMSERARGVGGEVAIDSQPGRGTIVCTRLPLRLVHPVSA
jgi:PAS domain S-box-containing protein